MKRKLTLAGAALAITTAMFGNTAHAGETFSDSIRRAEIMRNTQSVQRPHVVSQEGKEQRKRVKTPTIPRNPS